MSSRALVVICALLIPLTASVAPSSATGPCAAATIRGTDGNDVLRGTPGPDVIDGAAGDDRLVGLDGDDVLCGGPGQDVLVGGPGADALYGGTDAKVAEDTDYWIYYGDTMDGGPGADLLDGGRDSRHPGSRDTVTFAGLGSGIRAQLSEGTVSTTGATPETDTIVGIVESLVGTSHADTIIGSDRPEYLYGGRGPDHVDGRGGDDWVDAGTDVLSDRSANVLLGGAGDDTVNDGAGDDVLRGGRGDDGVQASGGIDRSYGGPGDDAVSDDIAAAPGQVLAGGAGHDYIGGITLNDRRGRYRDDLVGRIEMGPGFLTTRIDGWRLRLPVRSFEDIPTPAARLWTVIGTPGRDVMYSGMDDPVRLFGRGGNDELFGATGKADLLDGGPGRDTGNGWGGRDRLVSIEHIRR